MRYHAALTLLIPTLLMVSGCGGGMDVGLGSGSGTDALSGTLNISTAPYLVLDLSTGALSPSAGLADLTTNGTYTDKSMVFRRVRGAAGEFLLGVFEVTQAQWTRLAGTTPWTAVDVAVVPAPGVGGDHPAFNISYAAARDAVAAFNAAKGTKLAIPTAVQWTTACAAGSSGRWSWGDTADAATLTSNAVVRETLSGVAGPRAVGGRNANAFGFYDMHGNVWEWTNPGDGIRGGSWSDPALTAATNNTAGWSDAHLDINTPHALVGVRLSILP